MDPRVSVVMIFLNEERFIDEAVQSVFAQTYPRWELIFVDDGSTDGSTEIARAYAARYPHRVRYLEHPGHQNRGMSASRNLGIRHAHGEFIALLDADDVYLPDKLQRQVEILDAHPEAAMVYGATRHWFGWSGRPEDRVRDRLRALGVAPNTLIAPPEMVPLFLQGQAETPGTCAVLIRREAVEAVGGFDEQFRDMYEDQVFFYKLCLAAPVFVESGCSDLYRQHPTSALHSAVEVGEYHTERQSFTSRRFLHWLQDHLATSGIEHPEISEWLARELWPGTLGAPFPARPQRAIAPVPNGTPRPRWSVMISASDGTEHLEETLAAVLAQAPGREAMQIEVIDNACRCDDTAKLVRGLGGERVSYFRQPKRLGHAANFNTCLDRARGHLVHLLDASDMVGEGFYHTFQRLFAECSEVGAVFCRTASIDRDGQWRVAQPPLQQEGGSLHPGFEALVTGFPGEWSSIVVRRAVYEHLGGFDEQLPYSGYDMEMWLRVASHYPVGYETEPRILRRDRPKVLSEIVQRAGDTIRAMEAVQAYLPRDDMANGWSDAKQQQIAVQALHDALTIVSRAPPLRAGAQVWELLRCKGSFSMMLVLGTSASRLAYRKLQQRTRRVRDRLRGVSLGLPRRPPQRPVDQ